MRKVAPHFDAFIHPTETSGEAVRPKTSVEQTEDPSLLVLSPAEHSDSANNSEVLDCTHCCSMQDTR